MKTAKVIGNIWATRKDENLNGLKLLVIQPINLIDLHPVGEPIIAADIIGAGFDLTLSQCQHCRRVNSIESCGISIRLHLFKQSGTLLIHTQDRRFRLV